MSEDSVKKFFESARSNPELRKALEEAQDQAQFVSIVVDQASKAGFEISAEDVSAQLAAAASSVELDDAQLDQVAGGGWRGCGGSLDWTDGSASRSACCVGGQKREFGGSPPIGTKS